MPTPYLLIANKGSGRFSKLSIDRIVKMLNKSGIVVEPHIAADFAQITGLVEEFCRTHKTPTVIAAGGDGTINAVLNGTAGWNATCAILPVGTANVLARELAITSVEQAVSRIIEGKSRPFTAGRIMSGENSRRFFLMAGIGLDGYVVRDVSLFEKRLLGKGAYVLSTIRHACNWEREELKVTTGTGSFTCHSVFVCNAARYAGSFVMAPKAEIYSPTLELVAVRNGSRRAYVHLISDLFRGIAPINDHDFITQEIDWVRIEGEKPIQIDGDHFGYSPVEIVAEPEYARIMV